LVKVVNKEPTTVVTAAGQTVVTVPRVMPQAQAAEVSLVSLPLNTDLTGNVLTQLSSLVQAVVVVTNQEEPVVVRTVTTVVDVPLTVLLKLMVVAAAKVSTANTSEVVMVTNVVSKTLKPLTAEEEVPVTSVAKAAAPMLEVDPVVQASAIPASVLLAQLALLRTVTVSTMDQTVHQVLVNLVTSLVAVKVEELTVVTVVSPSLGMVTPINLKT